MKEVSFCQARKLALKINVNSGYVTDIGIRAGIHQLGVPSAKNVLRPHAHKSCKLHSFVLFGRPNLLPPDAAQMPTVYTFDWALANCPAEHIIACTSSQALLKAIQSDTSDAQYICKRLDNRRGPSILTWVPDYKGIPGNNTADTVISK